MMKYVQNKALGQTSVFWPCFTLGGALLLALLLAGVSAARAGEEAYADALFETAMSGYKLERFEDAGNKFYDFMAAAPNDPRNDRAQYYAARCLMHRNYLQRAAEEFGYVIDDFPDSPFASLALHDRAQCYFKTREDQKAVADTGAVTLRKVEIYHGDEDALKRQLYENHRADTFWLANYYLERKEHDKAIEVYQRLPYPMEAFRNVVNVYYSLNNDEKIKELINTLQGENQHEGFKYLIEFYGVKKAVNQLKDIFSMLLQTKEPTRSTDDLVWHTASSFRNSGGEYLDWAMRQISQFYPRMARQADHELARNHWQEITYLDELELFVIKYRNGGDVDEVLRWKGVTEENAGRAEEARKDYRRMSNPGLGHWYVAETYHGRYAKAKDIEAAIEEYARLRTAFYTVEWSAMAQWRIADLHRELKQLDKVAEDYRQIVQRFATLTIESEPYRSWQQHFLGLPERHYGPAGQLALGDVLREAGLFDDAEMEYRALIRKFPKSEEASLGAYRTAFCYEGREDPENAIKVLKSVMRRYPKASAASQAHTRLETRYNIEDTEVSDEIDVFSELEEKEKDKRKNFLEDPSKMKQQQEQKPHILP